MPRELSAVAGESALAVASLEAGEMDDAGDDGGQCQVALTRAGSMQNARQSDLRSQTDQSRDMSVRQRAVDGEYLVEGVDADTAFQKDADDIDDECRGFGEVGEGFAFDAFSVAQQDRWAAVAVRYGFDVNRHSCIYEHGNIYTHKKAEMSKTTPL